MPRIMTGRRLCIILLLKAMVSSIAVFILFLMHDRLLMNASCVCEGDAAVALLKAGADFDKKDVDGHLPLDLAPDKEVSLVSRNLLKCFGSFLQCC